VPVANRLQRSAGQGHCLQPTQHAQFGVRITQALMATSNSPRQDGKIVNFLACLVRASFLRTYP
jgi:hypothetical protein